MTMVLVGIDVVVLRVECSGSSGGSGNLVVEGNSSDGRGID